MSKVRATRSSPPAGASEDILRLAANLRLAVVRLSRRLRQHADTGESPSMLSALSSIERLGPLTIGDLAAVEGVAPPTMTPVVARLEAGGLAAREPDPRDRRIGRLTVTREGRQLLDRSRSRKTAYLARRLRALGEQDRATLERAARIMEDILEDGS